MNIEEDYAIPDKSLKDALSLVHAGDEFLPAWAIATLFLRSQGHKLTKDSILDAARKWVGGCRLGLVEHQGKPYDHDEIIPSMAQLPIEFAPKRRVSSMDVLVNLKSAIDLADITYLPGELVWIKAEINKISNNSELQTESIVTDRHADPKPTSDNGDDEEGKPKERQTYLRSIWEEFGKPNKNDKIWAELKKRTNPAGRIKQVIGYEEFTFEYENGSSETLSRKTFQNDMAEIRKQK